MDDSGNTNADYEILMLDEQQNTTFVEDESIRDPVTMLSILIVGTFLSLLIFFSIAGNILVCVAIYTDRGLRRIGNLFLASLAIADLFVASLVMTFAGVNDLLGYWIFGAQFCDTWVAFDVMCSTASILNLCAISLDRYIHIKDPLRYGRWVTRRVAVATIATIWLLAALISFVPISLGLHRPPQPFIYHDEHGQHYPTCALDLTPSYAVISSCISFYVPCIVMIGIYCRLYCYAQKHVKSIRAVTRPIEIPSTDSLPEPQQSDGDQDHNICTTDNDKDTIVKMNNEKNKLNKKQLNINLTTTTQTKTKKSKSDKHLHMIHLHNHQSSPYHVSDHKAAITVGVIMGVFLICWVPFFCINIVAAFCKTCIPDITFKILTWLGYSNSAFNPIIYSIFNTEFREAFKRILTTHYPDWCHCCNKYNNDTLRSSKGGGIGVHHHHHHFHHQHKTSTSSSHQCYHRNNSLSSYKRRHSSIDHSFNENNYTSNLTITKDEVNGSGSGTRAMIVTASAPSMGSPINGQTATTISSTIANTTTTTTTTTSSALPKRLNNRTNSVNYSSTINTNIKNTIKHNSIDSSLQQYCRTNTKVNHDDQISSI